jgi:hypothetical protein
VIRRAFIGAAAVTLAAPRLALAESEAQGEAGILRAAVELEQLVEYVYDAGVKSGLLDGELAAAMQTLRDQEQQHADALATSLGALGSPRPPAPRTLADADAALERLGVTTRLTQTTTAPAFLALAEELELREVGLYVAAVGDLEDVRLIQTCASILGAEGAHLVVIRRALGREPLPKAVETGVQAP